MIEKHLRTKDVAALLSLHEETVLRYAQRGELRSIRLGRERRYPESAVAEFLERQEGARVIPLRRAMMGSRREEAS